MRYSTATIYCHLVYQFCVALDRSVCSTLAGCRGGIIPPQLGLQQFGTITRFVVCVPQLLAKLRQVSGRPWHVILPTKPYVIFPGLALRKTRNPLPSERMVKQRILSSEASLPQLGAFPSTQRRAPTCLLHYQPFAPSVPPSQTAPCPHSPTRSAVRATRPYLPNSATCWAYGTSVPRPATSRSPACARAGGTVASIISD